MRVDEITYSPFKHDRFVVKATGAPVESAEFAVLDGKRVWAFRPTSP